MPAETARAVWSIGVAIVLAVTANLAVYAVLTANQAAGVYPPEADTRERQMCTMKSGGRTFVVRGWWMD